MKLLFAALSASFFIVNPVSAESITLFDAKEQCRALETTEGVRYIPPCTLPDSEFSFTVDSSSKDIDPNPSLAVYFQCTTLRPLSFRYQLSRNGDVFSTGNMEGSREIEQAQSSFSLGRTPANYTFKLIQMDGATGFQAIKPDCKVVATTNGDDEVDSATFTELTKINIAIWETTTRAVKKRWLIKYEIDNAKYWLETIQGWLSPENTAVVAKLNDTIEQLEDILETCSNTYCGTTAIAKIKTLNENSEEALVATKELLNEKLEDYDFGSGKINAEVTAWLQLRTLINETLTPSKEDND